MTKPKRYEWLGNIEKAKADKVWTSSPKLFWRQLWAGTLPAGTYAVKTTNRRSDNVNVYRVNGNATKPEVKATATEVMPEAVMYRGTMYYKK